MLRKLALSFTIASLVAAPAAAAPQSLRELKQTHQALMLDGSLDRDDLLRLQQVALSDDLLLDRAEARALASFVRANFSRDFTDPPELVAPWSEAKPKGRLRRIQLGLVALLDTPLGSSRLERIYRELAAIALGPMTENERMSALTLVDNFRLVNTRHATSDPVDTLALLLANPEEARRDLEHRRRLERLGREFNIPLLLNLQSATSSPTFKP